MRSSGATGAGPVDHRPQRLLCDAGGLRTASGPKCAASREQPGKRHVRQTDRAELDAVAGTTTA